MRKSLAVMGTLLLATFIWVSSNYLVAQDNPDTPLSGELIAFVSWQDNDAEIYTINSDGTDLRRLTHSPGDDYTPAWSPDGKYLAFTSMRDGIVEGSQEIYVMRSDGSEPTNITNSENYDAFPAWSPDGKSIAFVSYRDSNTEIYVMNADGTDQTNLTHQPAEDMCPSWSPDGQTIAFSSNRDGNFDIYIMNLDDTEVYQVTSGITDDYCPVWLPGDEKTLVFAAYWGNFSQMYSISLDGKDKRQFAPLRVGETYPSWSPDGTRIAFISNQDNGSYDIYVVDREGNRNRLTQAESQDTHPAWQPVPKISDDDQEN